MYKHSSPYLEETDAHVAAIQLRRDKILLKRPSIKKRERKSVSGVQQLSKARLESTYHISRAPIEIPEQSASPSSMIHAPERRNTLPDGKIDDHDIISESTIHTFETTSSSIGISFSPFQQAIVDDYKNDVLFSEAQVRH